jgi:Zn-dependent protease with chaperone function
MSQTASLAWRAVVAIFLMAGYYLLAAALALGLVGVPVLALQVSTGLAFKIALPCLIGAIAIVVAMFPRPDRFEPPGPLLTPGEQPRLFAEIRGVAAAVGQAEPSEVYLVPDVNAWVGYRGGFMGIGSRRVMGLGLPLLQVLRVPELRGVIAHEFGHLHGGDLAIGPWIHQTSSALARTVEGLQSEEVVGAMAVPFVAYARLFFRVSHAVSRHQEVLADRLAAKVAGARAVAGGLRQTNAVGPAFQPYWHAAVAPLVDDGFLPPLAAGFEAFLETPWVAEKVAEQFSPTAAVPAGSPYDTHPPLPERLAALGVAPSDVERAPGPPALTLLDRLPELERGLVDIAYRRVGLQAEETGATLNIARDRPALIPVGWDEVGARVWVPRWRKTAREVRAALRTLTPAALPEADWAAIGRSVAAGADGIDHSKVADAIVGAALAVLLVRAGFAVVSRPASEPLLVGPAGAVAVFGLRERLAQGQSAVQEWRSFCRQVGIADEDLGQAMNAESGPQPS